MDIRLTPFVVKKLGLTAAASAKMQLFKRNFWIGYGNINNFNEEMDDIMKIVKSLGVFGLLNKGVSGGYSVSRQTLFMIYLIKSFSNTQLFLQACFV